MPFLLGLSNRADGGGPIQPLAKFMTNPAGSAIVNAVGPLRDVVTRAEGNARRYLVIATGDPATVGPAIQVQQ